MEQVLELTKGDNLPTLRGQYTDEKDTPLPITGLTIELRIKKTASTLVKTAVEVDGAGGIFEFPWEPGDLDEIGTMPVQCRVIDANGNKLTLGRFYLLVEDTL